LHVAARLLVHSFPAKSTTYPIAFREKLCHPHNSEQENRPMTTNAKIVNMRNEGFTYAQIAAHLQVSEKRVRYWCNENERYRRQQEGKRRARRIAAEQRETTAAARQAAKAERHRSKEAALAAYRSEQARKKAERALLTKVRKRLRNTTKGAEVRGLDCELTEPDVIALLATGACVRTGIAFEPGGDFGVSLDRIDNSRGYLRGNVQAVCWAYNRAKGASTDAAVLRLAVALVQKTIVDSGLSFEELKTFVEPTDWD
jgi:hypothetical protein